jgi:hypothetical protein
MIRRRHLFGGMRNGFLLVGLFVVSAGVLLVVAASQTRLIVAQQSLNHYWRTTYDILVRPAGVRSPIEEKYGLVEANTLSGIGGGITFSQYEAIKSIPGVEVAAPIAMIGYLDPGVGTGDMIFPPEPGVYVLEDMASVNDGVHSYTPPDFPHRIFYYFDRNLQKPPPDALSNSQVGVINVDSSDRTTSGWVNFPFLIAAIDPNQEAALVGLDRTLVSGEYLQENESLVSQFQLVDASGKPMPGKTSIRLPVLINANNYVNLTQTSVLKRILLPPDVVTMDEIEVRGGINYLMGLPTQTLDEVTADSRMIYQKMFEGIAPQLVGGIGPASVGQGFEQAVSPPGPILYREAQTRPGNYNGIVLDLVPPGNPAGSPWLQYRAASGNVEFNVISWMDPTGIFDITRLPKPLDVNRVPLETYFPPIGILRYDDQGHSINPSQEIHPTLNPAGYIQSPPLILTTLEAARAMRGEAAISAIRVRVALDGCPPQQPETCSVTPAAERKIETIAIEIQRRTGLAVDIMVGSSPARIVVHVPGVGYVEEQWIQKGVDLVYKQGIQAGSWLLLGTLLVAGGLFTLDLTWTEVVAHRRVIALEKALGWRSSSVFAQILGQVLLIGTTATFMGTLGALGLTRLLNWQPPPEWLVLGLPLGVLVVTTLGSFVPAWMASRTPPLIEIQRGGIHYRRGGSALTLGVWGYAWKGVLRRPGRSLLAGLTAMLSAALLVLLLAVLRDQQGLLNGTLLGEFILLHVEGFHYAIVIIGFGLAALSTTNGLLGSIIERHREIALLKAVGWRTGAVARLFVLEGMLLGFTGGAVGSLLGGLIFVFLYRSAAPGLGLAILVGVGVPGLVGTLAALYPAHQAARMLPAEAVRYE